MSIVLFWWSWRFTYFFFFILFHFVIDNSKPTCLDCVNIYSCILSLLKLQGTFCFMNSMCCIHLILTKSVVVRYTNLFDFWFDKRQWYVKRMETKLEYLLDSGTTLNMLEFQKYFRKMGICINNGPTQHCSIGKNIFLHLLEKQKAL